MTQPAAIQNALGIITDAMIDVGKLRMGGEPGSEDLAQNSRRLNKLINYLMTQGCKLFLIEDVQLTLVPPLPNGNGVNLYTLGPTGTVVMQKPLRVISAYYLYNGTGANSNQYPLVPISYPDEWNRLSNLLSPGPVNSYAVDKQSVNLNVHLWNPPDAFTCSNGSVVLQVETSVTNFVGITDTMQFPIEWSLALEWGLAEQISTGQPVAVQGKAAAMAMKYIQALEDWDVEDADTMFQPDQRMYQNTGRFK